MIIDEPVIILAGGFGSRLKTVVADVPKPLAPVAGRPFLDYLLEGLYSQGVRRVVISLYHLAHVVLESLPALNRFAGMRIETVVEPEPLGTGGAISYAVEQCRLSGPLYACNGDTYLSEGITQLRAADPECAHASMGVVAVEDCGRYGATLFDPVDLRVTSFAEKSDSAGRGWINSGLYRFDGRLLPRRNSAFSLERDVFPELVTRSMLYACPLDADFIDIGIPEDYARFVARFER